MVSHESIIFPIAVVCHTSEYKISLDRVSALVNTTDWEGVTPNHAAEFLYQHEAIEAVNGDKWYPAPICAKPAIYSH